MKITLWKWLVAFGVFLILTGVAGYLSNPEKAKTALISGGSFGLLNILWGVLLAKRLLWARMAAFLSTAFLTVVFGWRSWAGWMAVAAGEPKLVAASLITAMLVASLTLLPLIVADIARSRTTAGCGL